MEKTTIIRLEKEPEREGRNQKEDRDTPVLLIGWCFQTAPQDQMAPMSLAMTMRWTSEVPSPTSRSFWSR